MKYLVFDCHYFCWRAFHSSGKLSHNDKGTGVIYGFVTQILIMCRQFGLTDPVFMWDSRKRFRSQVLPGYKKRDQPKTDEEKEAFLDACGQIQTIRTTIMPLLGFGNSFIQTGLEADDLIAIFVKERRGQSVVLTNDEDLLQLTDDCAWYSPAKKKLINGRTFRAEYGITPRQWAEVKAIAGCNSDKVPGVAGVGNTTALRYLKGELTKGKKFEDIVSYEGKRIAGFNKQLVDLPHAATKPIKLQKDNFNPEGFLAICDLYGFKKLAGEVDEWIRHFKKM